MAASGPVIVGVGQRANKDPECITTPLELIRAACASAVQDSQADLLPHVDGLFLSPPWAGDSEGAVNSLAAALELRPGERRGGQFSGSTPQELISAACQAIADGELAAVLVCGGVCDASVKRAVKLGRAPAAPPSAKWSGGARRPGPLTVEQAAGTVSAVTIFSMVESQLAAEAGRTPDEQRAWLGGVMAPFSAVAESHPDTAWFPRRRTAEDIAEVRADNRIICEPYTKLMTSFPDVDLAAAVLITSTELADRLHVPHDRRVYPWAGASCHEAFAPSGRPSLSRPRALRAAVERTMEHARMNVADVTHFDVYSCFPASVQMCAEALGVDPHDPRGLTVTGGLPYFGGPGAAYGAHAIANVVETCRTTPGARIASVSVGGFVANFAAAVYSAEPPPRPWTFDPCHDIEAALRTEHVPPDLTAGGTATVEAMTVVHDRTAGPVAAPVFARLANGCLTGAAAAGPELAKELSGQSLVGSAVTVTVRDGQPVFDIK